MKHKKKLDQQNESVEREEQLCQKELKSRNRPSSSTLDTFKLLLFISFVVGSGVVERRREEFNAFFK